MTESSRKRGTETGAAGPPAAARDAQAPRPFTVQGAAMTARPAAPGLHVVSTPIGNLGDITLRALETLAGVDAIACEDTRVTGKLLHHFRIKTPLFPYHEHNAAEARPKLLARLAQGGSLALVSDAGTPLISDPGYKLVVEARAAGHCVTPIPGACAALAALTAAGLPSDRFFFEGFLPSKDAGRKTRIAALLHVPATLILYETGPRIAAALAALAEGLGAREAAVCRELTKLYEEVRRGDLAALAQHYAQTDPPKGEIVIVIAPPLDDDEKRVDASDIEALLHRALTRVSMKDAVGEVASATGVPRREVYQRALALKDGAPTESGTDD
jgi:16S rRNA (cytidine1402-2'-O)-methyltransferase